MITDTAAQVLLNIARTAIAHEINQQSFNPPPREEQSLNERAGCFVTLKMNGQLRGCIGNFQSRRPLFQEVALMAAAAATQDPRFSPLTKPELDQIHLEITILSPLEKISGPDDITIGEHGIYLEHGINRGVLLPQVATEHQWDALTFLRQTCNKAGLSADMWQAPDAEIYRFSGEIIAEKNNLD
ncbi:AmmeMemoRadiSam system protein A [Pelovirga terrestris]|uniref:AmmeMemoRadiSam system protein A n=1 Tax=Pelovirga terrestris TaxID=2771352 RepID=A0A8J6UQK1_9BACT|nr:AmmeMemoRadiSam system protein A [Pelovirga terrestris]MBD1399076.1 AmmeMemoRadiSam system protein A [Pelovirga terrestris]